MNVFNRKVSKFFRALKMVAAKPAVLNLLLDNEDEHQKAVQSIAGYLDGLPDISFFDLVTAPEIIEPFAFLDGGSLPTDIALLKALGRRNCESYFEIGTWRGESVRNMADLVTTCYTLHLGAENMRKRGWKEEHIRLHEYFSMEHPGITQLHGDSRTFDFSPFYGKQDLVFVDGDHHFDTVVSDTRQAFKLLRGDKSMIVWHDYGHNPEEIRWNILHAILEGTPPEKRKHLYAVSNTLCAVYIQETLPSRKRIIPAKPDPYFAVEIRKHKT